jgi:hypothetical protein
MMTSFVLFFDYISDLKCFTTLFSFHPALTDGRGAL